jgi:hypothetical protein
LEVFVVLKMNPRRIKEKDSWPAAAQEKVFPRKAMSEKWRQKNNIGPLRSERKDSVYYISDWIFLTLSSR